MKQLILVDACNFLHRIPAWRDRLSQGVDLLAAELLTALRPLHDLEHWELHLIVDGRGSAMRQEFIDRTRTLSLLWCAAHQSADTVIESWIMRLNQEWKIVVATEDRAIAHTAISHGAEVLNAAALMDWVDRVLSRYKRNQQSRQQQSDKSFGNRLEGLF